MRQHFEDEYWPIWQRFVLQGALDEERLPLSVVHAWQRCALLGLNPHASQELKLSKGAKAQISQDLLRLVRPAIEDLYQFAEEAECVVVFGDANVRIADLVGNQHMLQELESLGLSEGVLWSEEQRGANALALALRESFPTHLNGARHYRPPLHPSYTA